MGSVSCMRLLCRRHLKRLAAGRAAHPGNPSQQAAWCHPKATHQRHLRRYKITLWPPQRTGAPSSTPFLILSQLGPSACIGKLVFTNVECISARALNESG